MKGLQEEPAHSEKVLYEKENDMSEMEKNLNKNDVDEEIINEEETDIDEGAEATDTSAEADGATVEEGVDTEGINADINEADGESVENNVDANETDSDEEEASKKKKILVATCVIGVSAAVLGAGVLLHKNTVKMAKDLVSTIL